MMLTQDFRSENILIYLNRALLSRYGSNLVLGKVREDGLNKFAYELDYSKVFNIVDERTNTIFVRSITFPGIYESKMSMGDDIDLPLDEINSAISSQYSQIRENIIQLVLSKRDLIIALLKDNHISSAFLNKFHRVLNQLIISEVFSKDMIAEISAKDKNFHKYVELIIAEGFAKYDDKGNLKATSKLNLIFKEKKSVKKSVDEALYLLIQKHYDYIVYDLNIRILKTYVNIISCLVYLINYQGLQGIRMKLEGFYRIYLNFYDKVDFSKFVERVNNLIYSDIIKSDNNYISLSI